MGLTGPEDRDHLEQSDYASFAEALADADRVAQTLLEAIDGQLLVRSSDVDFLAQRLLDLVQGCSLAIPAQAHRAC